MKGVLLNREQRRQAERDMKRLLGAGAVDLAAAAAQVKRISLAYVHPGLVHELWMMSVLNFIARSPGKYAIRPMGVESGPLLARARNTLVGAFLDAGDDYLLFTDTDVVFNFADVELLVQADVPIAGALYFSAAPSSAGEPWCTALEAVGDEGFKPLQDIPSEPRTVDAVGMGLTLIRRDVLEALAPVKKLWPFAETDEERGFGEDVTFCLRAKEAGFETTLVPAARVGHIKETIL
jgi:hypothetical protein